MNPMKFLIVYFLLGVLSLGLPAIAISSNGQGMAAKQAEAYNGPKARIAVADFEDKMSSHGQYRGEYGRGMSDMLTTALFNSNRYIVLEREKLKAVMVEQDLGASGRFRRETAAPIGQLEGAELMVTAAITGFDPGVAGGGGGLGSLIPGKFGAIAGAFKKAYVAMDIRVIDTRTGRILSATNVDGSATTFGGGISGMAGGMGGALGGFAKTPMETAIREMIQKAVDFVVAQTPQTYYHYSATGEPMGGVSVGAGSGGGTEVSQGAGTEVAKAMPQDERGTPKTKRVIQSIKSDFDKDLVAHLNEVTRRGVLLSIMVSLSFGGEKESEYLYVNKDKSHVMDYNTGQTYPVVNIDGSYSGRIRSGEVTTMRVTFKAPKDAKVVGITISGLGTFDDVKLE
jgi:curli biogenesis system outer membrane secretion channel CsgG